LSTAVAWAAFPRFELTNLIMVYLLGVVLAATRLGRGPAILASILSVAAFDFFFVPPYLTFAVANLHHLVTFGVMLTVAIVFSTLTVEVRRQADIARRRERRTAALYGMSRDLASVHGVEELANVAARHIGELFDGRVVVLLADAAGWLAPLGAAPVEPDDQAAAREAYESGRMAGRGTALRPAAGALFVPLVGSRGRLGALGVRSAEPAALAASDQRRVLEAMAGQTALAIERARFADEAQQAQLQVEAERLRSTLLSSVSHDLRTPLAAITGAASSLVTGESRLDPVTRRELGQSILEESERLSRLVHNLLDMTRLEAGPVKLHREWHPLEELVGAALSRRELSLRGRQVTARLADDLPLLALDGLLIEQVLGNLLDNALAYTPAGSPLEIVAWPDGDVVRVELADRGPGYPPGDLERVFEKFYRGRARGTPGVGLGLTICQAIVEAHGGRIWVENRPEGGAKACFTLPRLGAPPVVETEAS
jgi:two-component system, OmpR family, sensor histidine kinase KdpD